MCLHIMGCYENLQGTCAGSLRVCVASSCSAWLLTSLRPMYRRLEAPVSVSPLTVGVGLRAAEYSAHCSAANVGQGAR